MGVTQPLDDAIGLLWRRTNHPPGAERRGDVCTFIIVSSDDADQPASAIVYPTSTVECVKSKLLNSPSRL